MEGSRKEIFWRESLRSFLETLEILRDLIKADSWRIERQFKNPQETKTLSNVIIALTLINQSPSQRMPGFVFKQRSRPFWSKVHSLGKLTLFEHPLPVSIFLNSITFYKIRTPCLWDNCYNLCLTVAKTQIQRR